MSDLRSNLIRVAYMNRELRPRLMQALTATAMPESDFWKIVDDLGWGTRTTDYKVIKKQLLRNLSPNQAASLQTTFAQMQGKLYKALTAWEENGDTWMETGKHGNPRSFGLGDDSFGDLIAHIIGMGKREFAAVLKNPQLAHDRARKNAFKESFSYALPSTSDYAKLDVSTYQKEWAKVHGLAEWLLMRPEIPRAMVRPLQILTEGTDTLRRKGAHAFIAMEPELVGAAKLVQDWWDKFSRDWEAEASRAAMYKAMPDSLMQPSHIYWGAKNIITDMQDFLLD